MCKNNTTIEDPAKAGLPARSGERKASKGNIVLVVPLPACR